MSTTSPDDVPTASIELPRLPQYGSTRSAVLVALKLAAGRPISSLAIARATGRDPAGIQRILVTMERHGIVTRRRLPSPIGHRNMPGPSVYTLAEGVVS